MSYKVKQEEEVRRSFEENPQLCQKTLQGIGEWFYIQGELRFDAALQALRKKAEHYRTYLTYEQKIEADRAWKGITDNE